MSAGGAQPPTRPPSRPRRPARGRQHREKITPYDFKRPERVGKEQMRALQTLHEGFGGNFGAALSALLRTIVEVKLTSVDQLTYSEFVFSLDNPTCFNLLEGRAAGGQPDPRHHSLDPLSDHRPHVGRGPRGRTAGPRPLTEIELRLVSRITGLFLDELRHAWENVLELKLELSRWRAIRNSCRSSRPTKSSSSSASS